MTEMTQEEKDARQMHRRHYDVSWARSLLMEACQRSLPDRIDTAVVDAVEHIRGEAQRERGGTVIDFLRADVQRGVAAELRQRGFKVEESKFRVTSEPGGDAVPALLVYW